MKENDLNNTELYKKTKPIDVFHINTTSNDGLIIEKKENKLNLSSMLSIDNFKKKFWSFFIEDDSENKEKRKFEKFYKNNEIKSEDIDFEREYKNIAEKNFSQVYSSINYMGLPF